MNDDYKTETIEINDVLEKAHQTGLFKKVKEALREVYDSPAAAVMALALIQAEVVFQFVSNDREEASKNVDKMSELIKSAIDLLILEKDKPVNRNVLN